MKLGNHAVAWLDLLGQRRLIEKVIVPERPEEEEEAIRILQECLGYSDAVDRHIRNQAKKRLFDTLEKREIPKDGMTAYQNVRARSKRDIYVHSVSDSWIVGTELGIEDGKDIPEFALMSLFTMLAVIHITCAGADKPIRGGVAAGAGVLHPSIGPYGPAIATAYDIESKISDYSRIVVDKKLVAHLHTVSSSSDIEEIRKSLAQMALEHVAKDEDGHFIIVLSHNDQSEEQAKILDAALQKSVQRYEEERETGDPKLAMRYLRLSRMVQFTIDRGKK